MTDGGWATDQLELIARRVDFVGALADGAARPHELVEQLGVSRSTVSRALRELSEAGLVRRTDDGYAATVVGRIAATQYRSFAEGTTAAVERREALAPLPPDAPLGADFLDGATTHQPGEDADPTGQLVDLLAEADRVRLLTGVAPPTPVVRACRKRASEGATMALAAPPVVRDTAEMTDETPVRMPDLAGDVAPFTLLVVEAPVRTAAVVVYDRRAVHAVLVNDNDQAVSWAESLYAARTDDEASAAASPTELPPALRDEGFVRVAAAVDRHEPAAPATAWRTGFGLAEVCAGLAVDRTYPDGGERRVLADELVEGLRDGTAHALVGPPGAGKSTACKLVACRWYEAEFGPVFYREAGHGSAFESVARLADRARTAPGHALVVVEDAVRRETNAVFRLLDACRDDPDVSVLVDTREREWYESGEFPADARLRSYRTEIETVRMPAVDERECERLIEAFETATGRTVPTAPAELLAGIREANPAGDGESAPGELFLLFHRLAATGDHGSLGEQGAPSALEADVLRTYRALADAGPAALTVGALANLLNAAGVGIHPEYLHALAVVPEGPGRTAVDKALTILDGQVLFGDSGRGPYRSVHGMWSTAFLRRLLAETGERTACRHVTAGLDAVLALADDPDHCRAVRRVVAGETTRLDDVETAPGEWAETLLRRIFRVGRDHPGLAPLFGGPDGLVVTVPDAAPPSLAVECQLWHGRMYTLAGEFTAAERAFDRAERALGAADLENEQALRADCRLERSDLARKRGDFDAADDHASAALERYRSLQEDRGRADALVKLGAAARGYGDYETARRYIEEGLRLHRELGATRAVASDLQSLAMVAWLRGDLTDAEAYAERALERARELGHERGRATGLMTLGLVARMLGNLGDAETYTRRALERYRELRDVQGEADALGDLSAVLREQGNLEAASTAAEEALALARDIGDRPGEGRCLARLGAVAHEQGNLGEATDRLERALAVMRETGDQHGEAEALVLLASIDRDKGHTERAADRLEQAVRLHRTAGARRDALDAIEQLVDVLAAVGDRRDACDWCDEGADLAMEYGIDERATALEERRRRLVETES
ncbi:tetratricopeptide repeat protein [Halosegnis sp.]|uniref:tetratricopeptide repeat protein n=1 Tax=Halosegnis sp. TaxID=2864959 RepID=UPI0035D418AF